MVLMLDTQKCFPKHVNQSNVFAWLIDFYKRTATSISKLVEIYQLGLGISILKMNG